ncbi:MAG: hypothetical protein WC175_03515 [Candidatus Dojkabacteria bacterium]
MELKFKENLEQIPRTYQGYPSVTSILSVLEDPFYIRKWKASLEDPTVADKKIDIARQRGTYLHMVAEDYYKKGVKNFDEDSLSKYKEKQSLPEITPKILKFLNGFNKFTSLYDLLPINVEDTFVNKKFGYAGTKDLIAFYNDKVILVDWKTCSSARLQQDALEKYWMQQAAYAADWNLNNPNQTIEEIWLPTFTDVRASGLGEMEILDNKNIIRNYFLLFLECKREFDKLWKSHANYPNGVEILNCQD